MNKLKLSNHAQKGTVSRITDRGFGFISVAEEKIDIFFHANELIDIEYRDLQAGELLWFEVVDSGRGRNAMNIGRNNRHLYEEQVDDEDETLAKVRIRFKNFSSELAKMIANDPHALEGLEWRDLERIIAEVFDGLGFDVVLTPSSKDGGKDVIVTCRVSNETRSYLVEIKHWRSENRVGSGIIMDFLHVIVCENRNGGLLLATGGYCNNAFENLTGIERKKIRFGTKEKIVSLCQNYSLAQEGVWYPPKQLDEIIFD